MEWMSPVDSSFLHVENDTTPMHIGAVSIFEGPPPPFEDLRAMVAGKLGLVPSTEVKIRHRNPQYDGDVISQHPPAHSSVPAGSTVVIVIESYVAPPVIGPTGPTGTSGVTGAT